MSVLHPVFNSPADVFMPSSTIYFKFDLNRPGLKKKKKKEMKRKEFFSQAQEHKDI